MKPYNLILPLLVVIVILFSGCVESETPTKGETGEAIKAVETPEEEAPTELILKVGETAKTSKLEVTVLTAEKTSYYEYYSDIWGEMMIEEAKVGKSYVLIEAEIKNIGSDVAYAGSDEFSVTGSEGYRYDPELYYGDDRLEMFKELYQNQKTRGKVLFQVPEDAIGLKIQYNFGFWDVKLTTWELE